MHKYLFFLVFLTSCHRPITYHIEPEFIRHIATFEAVTGHPVNLDMSFGTTPSDIAATCFKRNTGNYIIVNEAWWDKAVDSSHEQVIFHELGHCIFDMVHDSNRIILDGVSAPESIMYPKTFGFETYYINHRDYYFSQYLNIAHNLH